MKKILFCYFHLEEIYSYTPLDIGYIVAKIKKDFPNYSFEIIRLSYNREWERRGDWLKYDLSLLEYCRPEAIFFFVDDILWSGADAFERAKKVARGIKKQNPKVFIGFQSFKISELQAMNLFQAGIADCVVQDDPESSFQFLEKILAQVDIDGVLQSVRSAQIKSNDRKKNEQSKGCLDSIPSPYLTGIFDNLLLKSQIECGGNFESFLYSSRGCPFHCHYCFRSVKFESLNAFSPQRFYDEMEYLVDNFEIINFFVLDDIFLVSKDYAQKFAAEFCERKKKNTKLKNINLRAMMRPETFITETASILKELNATWIQLGLQTVNPKLQKYMTRTIPLDRFREISEELNRAGIRIHLDVIMGLPGDTVEYFEKTLNFALGLNPYSIQTKQLYLNPNTLFHRKKVDYGIKTLKGSNRALTPFVSEAGETINEEYFMRCEKIIKLKINKFPELKWRHFSARGNMESS